LLLDFGKPATVAAGSCRQVATVRAIVSRCSVSSVVRTFALKTSPDSVLFMCQSAVGPRCRLGEVYAPLLGFVYWAGLYRAAVVCGRGFCQRSIATLRRIGT
jgi:hypothetical protein